jgi:hypothetical protein
MNNIYKKYIILYIYIMSELNTAISPPMDITGYKSISTVKVSRVSIQPENKTDLALTGSNTSDVYFAINSRPNSFLNGSNSYLSFTYTLEGTTPTAGSSVGISNGTGASFIRTLETIAGSTSLELINDYGPIACLVDDFQNGSRSKTLGTILEDKSASLINKKANVRPTAVVTDDGFTQKRRICIPVMSVAVGTLQDKYMPMGQDLGMRLRITFEAPDIALTCGTVEPSVLGYKLEDISFECEYLETDSATYNSIVQESGGVMKVSGTGIASFQTTVSAGSTSNTLLIPARFSSVRNMMTICRSNLSINTKKGNSQGARTRNDLASYVYRIHGKNFPNLEVPADNFTSAEVMCELLKCFHSLHNSTQSIAFDATNWVDSAEASLTSAFAIGIDFEEPAFSSSQMSGLSTNDGNTFLVLKHSAPCVASTYNTYCFYDTIIEIDTRSGEVMVSR